MPTVRKPYVIVRVCPFCGEMAGDSHIQGTHGPEAQAMIASGEARCEEYVRSAPPLSEKEQAWLSQWRADEVRWRSPQPTQPENHYG